MPPLRFRFGPLLLIWLNIPLAAQQSASDTQLWSEIDLQKSAGDRIHFLVPIVIRNSLMLGNTQLFAAGATADYDVTRHFTITAGYLFAELPQTPAQFKVHVPLAAISSGLKVRRLFVGDRNRVERLYGLPGNPYRYRNRILLDYPLAGAWRKWHVFTTDEAIYNLTAGSWQQNRFQAGTGKILNRRLSVDAYYMLRNTKLVHPTVTHIIGVTFRFDLNTKPRPN